MTKTATKQGFTSKPLFKQLLLLVLLIVLIEIMNLITGSNMLSMKNITKNILPQAVFPTVVAWGMMFIFGTGLVDLSIGAQVILGANIGAILAMDAGLGYVGLIIAPFIVIVICELVVVFCSEILKIPGWIAGLGSGLIFEAIMVMWTQARSKTAGSAVITLGDDLRVLGRWPVNVIIMVVIFVIVYLLYNRTSIGINLKAIGGDPGVSSAVGINRRKALVIAAVIGALIVGASAILNISKAGSISASSGLASLSTIFKALAVTLIANSLSAWVSEPVGAFGAGIFVSSLFNFLTIMGVQAGTLQEVILGAVVIICGVLARLNYKGVAK
ncbi:MAG: hypothetical protein IJ106_09625 [Parasporobacterium sp.]|nr:hypothetical protein [Parasporobacterium sp.]